MNGLLIAAVAIVLTVAAVTLWLDDRARLPSKHWLLTRGLREAPVGA
jgi:hypothetical protein